VQGIKACLCLSRFFGFDVLDVLTVGGSWLDELWLLIGTDYSPQQGVTPIIQPSRNRLTESQELKKGIPGKLTPPFIDCSRRL